jgi:pimeloyl-ACP methyl ester carboxylesterase
VIDPRRLAIVALCGATAFVACSAAANLLAIRILAARHPVPGALVDIDGRAMHIYCVGKGVPTVVLESGAGDDWIYWQKVQPEAARASRVCAYDRGGLGWSDPRPGRRDARAIAADLHRLLAAAGERPPYVMVGASAGALYARMFAATFPLDVTGMVFVDGSTPEQTRALPGARYTDSAARQRHRAAAWEWIEMASGWSRLSGGCHGDVDEGLEQYAALARAGACRPSLAASALAEWDDFWHSADEVSGAGCCGDVPIVIVSQDPYRRKPGWNADAIAAQRIWNDLQEGLKALSPHSRRIIARGSGHHVMIDRPEVVVHAIGDVLKASREGARGAVDRRTIVE